MKILLLPSNIDNTSATGKLFNDLENIAKNKGYNIVYISNQFHKVYIIISSYFKKNNYLLLYPYFFLPTTNIFIKIIHLFLLFFIKDYNLFIYDIPFIHNKILLNRKIGLFDKIYEKIILNKSDYIYVFNNEMLEYFLKNYSLYDKKIIKYNFLPFLFNGVVKGKNRLNINKLNIIYAGNISKEYSTILNFIDNNLFFKLHIFGNYNKAINNSNLIIHNKVSGDKLVYKISKYDFGLIDYSYNLSDYLKYGTGSKFGLYLVSGLPLLVSEKLKYPSDLCKKYNLGIVFKDYSDLESKIKSLSIKEYNTFLLNIKKTSEKISDVNIYTNNFLSKF